MSTVNRVLKNTLYLYGKIAITSICLILSTRYTLKALGIEDFGIYNLICSTVVMLSFLNESMTASTQRFMSYAEGEKKFDKSIKIFNSSFVVHIGIACIVTVALFSLLPFFFGDYLVIPQERISAAKIIYLFAILSTCISIMTVPYNAVLIAHENMLYYSILGSINGILKLIAAIATIYVPTDKLIFYSVLLLAVSLLDLIIACIYCRKYPECKIELKHNVDKRTIKEMFSFAMWQLTYSASSILSIQGMSLILNSFFGTIMNAAQGIARQVCGQLMTLSSTMMSALNPVIVKSAGAKQQVNMLRIVLIGSKLSFFLVIVIALPVMFELPYLLSVWLTEVPEYAIMFCRYEIVQQIIASFTTALVTMIMGVGDIRNFQLFSSATYILRLPIIALLLYFYKIPEYAYWVATIGVVFLCVGRIYYAKKKCGLSIYGYLKTVIMPCLYVMIVVLSALFIITNIMSPSFIRLLTTFFVSFIILVTSVFHFALREDEKVMVMSAYIMFKEKLQRR